MPDSLIFDNVDDVLTVSMGNWAASGAYTQAVILKRISQSASIAVLDVITDLNGTTGVTLVLKGGDPSADSEFYTSKSGVDDLPTTAMHVATTAGWVLVAFGKQAGSDVGRFHMYRYDTNTWIHADGASASSDNSGNTSLQFSRSDYPNNMNLLIAGVWDSELSDGQVETLVDGKYAWTALTPKEAWRFNTLSTISSFAGTSTESSRTGTTLDVGDFPLGWTDSSTASSYEAVVLSDNPVAYYRMNEASGQPQDSSGNGNHTTTSAGTPVYSQAGPLTSDTTDAGIRLKSADFDHFAGTDLNLGDVFSIEAWVKRNDAVDTEYVLFSMGSQDGGLYIQNQFAKLAKTSVDFVASSTAQVANNGNYYHVVVTKNGSTRKVYLNGVDDTFLTGYTNQTCGGGTDVAAIGVEYAGGSPNGQFEGTVAEVAIYSTELSAARVLAHYNAAFTTKQTFYAYRRRSYR